MEGLHADVCSMQGTLQETPEVFHRVRVDIAVHVFNCVIDNLMRFQAFGNWLVRRREISSRNRAVASILKTG